MEPSPQLTPFAPPPRPEVLLSATRGALRRVLEGLEAGRRALVVGGPPGAGKSALLRALEREAAGRYRVVRCPFLHFAPEELERWLVSCMGPTGEAEAPLALRRRLLRNASERRTTLLLVDEAQSIPLETAARLEAVLEAAAGRLCVVLAGIAGPTLTALAHAFEPDVVCIPLHPRLDPPSAAALRNARLEDPHLSSDERPGLEAADLDALLRASGGVPGAFMRELSVHAARSALKAALPKQTRERAAPVATRSEAPRPAPRARRRPASAVAPLRTEGTRRIGPGLAAAAVALVAILAGWISTSQLGGAPAPEVASPASGAALAAATGGTISVNVNAVPWAYVRCGEAELGPTPLGGIPLAAGTHECEAVFADGTRERSVFEVDETSRFLSFRRDPGG